MLQINKALVLATRGDREGSNLLLEIIGARSRTDVLHTAVGAKAALELATQK